jgi:hypothetical protein
MRTECCIPNGLADFDATCLVNKQHLEKLPSEGVLFAERWRPFDKRSRRARTASVGDLAELVGSGSKEHSDALTSLPSLVAFVGQKFSKSSTGISTFC